MAYLDRMRISLYEKYGRDAIKAVIDDLFDRVLVDPSVNYYFEGKDMESLHRQQVLTISYLLGSQEAYNMARLRDVHHGLNIQESQFETFLRHFDKAMCKYNFEIEDRAKILAILRSYKPFIVNK